MAILLKKLHQPFQMSAVTISRAIAFTTRNCSDESSKIYNTIRGTISHHFADSKKYDQTMLLSKVPKLRDSDLIQLDKLLHSLKAVGYTWSDIMNNPKVIVMPSYEIFYKQHLLKEFGFNNPKLHDLIYLKAHMNSEISFLKFYDEISEDTEVLQHLWENIRNINLPQTVFEEAEQRYPEIETTTLGELHIHFLKHYLSLRFSVEVECVEDFLLKTMNKPGPRVGPTQEWAFKALGRYPAICDTLLDSLQYDFSHVSMYPSLLNINPSSVEILLAEVPTIGGSSIYDIALEFPDILLIPVENIKQWITLLDKFRVTHFKVTKATLHLFFTGHYKAVEERLFAIGQHPEMKMICYSDKLFKILLQPYGVKRLVELLSSDQPLRNVNATIRIKPSQGKVTYRSRTPSELVNYVSQELDLEREEVKRLLDTHNNIHFGLQNSNLMIQLLKEYGFSREQMINGLEVLSFEYNDVNIALKGFSENTEAQPFTEWMKNPHVIHLLMYLIKKNGLYP